MSCLLCRTDYIISFELLDLFSCPASIETWEDMATISISIQFDIRSRCRAACIDLEAARRATLSFLPDFVLTLSPSSADNLEVIQLPFVD